MFKSRTMPFPIPLVRVIRILPNAKTKIIIKIDNYYSPVLFVPKLKTLKITQLQFSFIFPLAAQSQVINVPRIMYSKIYALSFLL